jgi:hypothetical protein
MEGGYKYSNLRLANIITGRRIQEEKRMLGNELIFEDNISLLNQ